MLKQNINRTGIMNALGVPLINDGMHRVFTAMETCNTINAVIIDNVSHPYYALPVDGGWSNVKKINRITEDTIKKTYRDPNNYKALFRDFNTQFPGIQVKRKTYLT